MTQAGKITAEEKETLIRCPPDPNPPAMPENARMGCVVFYRVKLLSREGCHMGPTKRESWKIIHSKVPAGRRYVSSQEGT